jgi:hypothetical protein
MPGLRLHRGEVPVAWSFIGGQVWRRWARARKNGGASSHPGGAGTNQNWLTA